jgi:hypothetical protein
MLPTNRPCGLGVPFVGERIGDFASVEVGAFKRFEVEACAIPSLKVKAWGTEPR